VKETSYSDGRLKFIAQEGETYMVAVGATDSSVEGEFVMAIMVR
jgi:hypothetical protein